MSNKKPIILSSLGKLQQLQTGQYIASDDISLSQLSTPSLKTLRNYNDTILSAGRINGLTITASTASAGTVNISSGYFGIKTSTLYDGQWKFANFSGQTGLALTDNTLNYIYMDHNSSTPIVAKTTDRTTIDEYNQFPIGRAYRRGTDVDITQSGVNLYNFYRRIHNRLIYKYGFDRATGSIVSEQGTRGLSVTEGIWYMGNTKLDLAAFATPGDSIILYASGGGGTWTTSTVTSLGNTQYDNLSGSLQTIDNNKYGVYWVYTCPEGDVYVLYGQAQYTESTIPSTQPTSVPDYISKNCKLIAQIVFKKGDTNFTSITSAFSVIFSGSIQTDHANLSNLSYASAGHTGFAPSASPTFTGAINSTGQVTARSFKSTGNLFSASSLGYVSARKYQSTDGTLRISSDGRIWGTNSIFRVSSRGYLFARNINSTDGITFFSSLKVSQGNNIRTISGLFKSSSLGKVTARSFTSTNSLYTSSSLGKIKGRSFTSTAGRFTASSLGVIKGRSYQSTASHFTASSVGLVSARQYRSTDATVRISSNGILNGALKLFYTGTAKTSTSATIGLNEGIVLLNPATGNCYAKLPSVGPADIGTVIIANCFSNNNTARLYRNDSDIIENLSGTSSGTYIELPNFGDFAAVFLTFSNRWKILAKSTRATLV